MKLHATITNENGATVSKGGNECLKIDIFQGNKLIGFANVNTEDNHISFTFVHGGSYHEKISKGKTPQSDKVDRLLKDQDNIRAQGL